LRRRIEWEGKNGRMRRGMEVKIRRKGEGEKLNVKER
jgi:hypothetical protein